jgi:hypothetical protein
MLRSGRLTALLIPLLALVAFAADDGHDAGFDRPDRITVSPRTHHQLQPAYKIEAGLDGDVFPAFANYASLRSPDQRSWGVVSVTISNPTETLVRERISVSVPGWSDEEVQIVDLAAGVSRKLIFAPSFQARFYQNREIVAATARINIFDNSGQVLYSSTVPLRLRAAEDMFWGKNFQYAPFIASWVMPHDSRVEQVLSRAKELVPGRRLPGYEEWKTPQQQEQSTYIQARAIYDALQRQGVSYVKSSLTFGKNPANSQRVRTPHDSIDQSSANCIDGVVLFASALENLGMEPVVLIVPGHAYVGVRVAQKLNKYLYVDTALTGRAPFARAIQIADRGLARLTPRQITRISIADARNSGIYPMPLSR